MLDLLSYFKIIATTNPLTFHPDSSFFFFIKLTNTLTQQSSTIIKNTIAFYNKQ